MRDVALYMNGVFQSVFDEIMTACAAHPYRVYYLQPHAGDPINYLRDNPPSPSDMVKLFASTTDDLRNVRYTADVIQWEHKRSIPDDKRARIVSELEQFQPGEAEMFNLTDPEKDIGVNLIYVARMQRLDPPLPVDRLILLSRNRPVSPNRATPGGWAYVQPGPISD